MAGFPGKDDRLWKKKPSTTLAASRLKLANLDYDEGEDGAIFSKDSVRKGMEKYDRGTANFLQKLRDRRRKEELEEEEN